MSIQAMTAVKNYSESRGAARLVMVFLADHADDFGFCWPGFEGLAHSCRLSVRTVMRHVATLVEAEEVAVLERPGKSSIYLLTIDGLLPIDANGIKRVVDGTGVTPDRLSPLTSRAQDVTRTVSNEVRDVDTSRVLNDSPDKSDTLALARQMQEATKGKASITDCNQAVCFLLEFMDERFVEEVITYSYTVDDPPRSAKWFISVAAKWGQQRGVLIDLDKWRKKTA